MRVVFDTAMLVAAVRSDAGASRRILVAALKGQLAALISVPLMIEYEAVLSRPEHLAAAGMSRADIEALLDGLALIAGPVRLSFRWRPALRDPDDDMVLETAVNGHADAIVTFNVRDFVGVGRTFGVDVLKPAELFTRLGWKR